ncbi:MAG: hypothetical protein ABWY28_13815, partial [Pseudomonas prosekii]
MSDAGLITGIGFFTGTLCAPDLLKPYFMTEPALLPRPQLRRMLRKARRALTPSQQRQAARGLY